MPKETESRELQKGERVGLYVVVRRESGGGHGTLYKVHHHVLKDSVYALKVLHANLRNNADIVRRMEREAQILSLLRHDNIVRVFDTGVTEERDPDTGASLARPFIAMEWLKGRTLAYSLSTARNRGVGLLPAMDIAIEVADALDYVHGRHVIHRDVKPENIFLQFAQGRPNSTLTKLLDFGIARQLGAQKITMRETMIGTALYASPEQARGEDPTPQTDAYAFGLVLYEMLVGRHPFEHAVRGNDMYSMLHAHISEKPAPLSDHEVPAPLARLVMSCLEKSPRSRPASMAAIGRKLREFYNEVDARARADLAQLSKTEPTPVQNVVTQAGGEVTDPGPPPDMGPVPLPANTEPDLSTTLGHLHHSNLPFGETRHDGLTVGNTQRMPLVDQAPTLVPSSHPPIDRSAMTRTAEPIPAVVPRTGTQPTPQTPRPAAWAPPKAQAAQPPLRTVGEKVVWVDPDAGLLSPRPTSSRPSSPQPRTTSTAGAVAMIARRTGPIPTPPGVRRAQATLAAVAAALTCGALGVAAFALSSPHVSTSQPPAASTVPAPSAAVLVASVQSPTVLPVPPPLPLAATTAASTSIATAVSVVASASAPASAVAPAHPTRSRPAASPRPSSGELPDGFKSTFQ